MSFDHHLTMDIGPGAIWTVEVSDDGTCRFSAESWDALKVLGEVIATRAELAEEEAA